LVVLGDLYAQWQTDDVTDQPILLVNLRFSLNDVMYKPKISKAANSTIDSPRITDIRISVAG